MGDYAIDGKCHNAQRGSYGHECGRPAVWIGETASGFRGGFCSECRRYGDEARDVVVWQRFNRVNELAR